jgi:hypothetical protein
MPKNESLAALMERIQPLHEEQDRKYGEAADPLTPEELDRSETEIHNMLRRRPAKPDSGT